MGKRQVDPVTPTGFERRAQTSNSLETSIGMVHPRGKFPHCQGLKMTVSDTLVARGEKFFSSLVVGMSYVMQSRTVINRSSETGFLEASIWSLQWMIVEYKCPILTGFRAQLLTFHKEISLQMANEVNDCNAARRGDSRGWLWEKPMRVLLVEDDRATAQGVELMLKSEGFSIHVTDLGEEGVDLGKLYDYDIILLDLRLPDMSGFYVLKTLRAAKVDTPVLILSGEDDIDDKVRGLGFGADDYMTKPFHKKELVARIHAVVRRSQGHSQSIIKTGDIAVNIDTKTVDVNGRRVHLTGKEYQMLELLSLRKGTMLTKDMFLNHLYGGMDEPEQKIIDVFMCKLRKKLVLATSGVHHIETIWGRGYVLRDPSGEVRAAVA